MSKTSWLRILGAFVIAGGIAWAALHRESFDVAAVQTRLEAMGPSRPSPLSPSTP